MTNSDNNQQTLNTEECVYSTMQKTHTASYSSEKTIVLKRNPKRIGIVYCLTAELSFYMISLSTCLIMARCASLQWTLNYQDRSWPDWIWLTLSVNKSTQRVILDICLWFYTALFSLHLASDKCTVCNNGFKRDIRDRKTSAKSWRTAGPTGSSTVRSWGM